MLVFWLTTALTILANILITREIVRIEQQNHHLQDKLQRLAGAAVSAYREGGRQELKTWYRSVFRHEGLRVVLLDEQRQSLAMPLNRKRADNDHEQSFDMPKPRYEYALASESGHVFTLRLLPSKALFEQRRRWREEGNIHVLRGLRLGLSALIILFGSLWLARSLAGPVNALRAASDKVAQGNLGTRLDSPLIERKDELGQLARAFNNMASQLEALMQRQVDLFSDISHEIRTPLTRQKLAIELARGADDPNKMLDKLAAQNAQIEHLVNQLLTLVKLDSNGPASADLEPSEEPLDLKAILQELVEEANLDLEDKALTIQFGTLPSASLRGNEDWVKRALGNVFLNAIKYSPASSEITLSGSRENLEDGRQSRSFFVLRIDDQGPGIPEAELDHVTQAFYRCDASRNSETGGYGLGLAMVERIMRQLGGSMRLSNRYHEDRSIAGLRVELRFPLVP